MPRSEIGNKDLAHELLAKSTKFVQESDDGKLKVMNWFVHNRDIQVAFGTVDLDENEYSLFICAHHIKFRGEEARQLHQVCRKAFICTPQEFHSWDFIKAGCEKI